METGEPVCNKDLDLFFLYPTWALYLLYCPTSYFGFPTDKFAKHCANL